MTEQEARGSRAPMDLQMVCAGAATRFDGVLAKEVPNPRRLSRGGWIAEEVFDAGYRKPVVAPSDTDPLDEEECEHDWPMLVIPGAKCRRGCGATRAGGAPSDYDLRDAQFKQFMNRGLRSTAEGSVFWSRQREAFHAAWKASRASQPVQVEVTDEIKVLLHEAAGWDADGVNRHSMSALDTIHRLAAALGGGE